MPIKQEKDQSDFDHMLKVLQSYNAREGSKKAAYISELTNLIENLKNNPGASSLSKISDAALIKLGNLQKDLEKAIQQSYRWKLGRYLTSRFKKDIHDPIETIIERAMQDRIHKYQMQVEIQTRVAPIEMAHKHFLSTAHPSLVALHKRIAKTSGKLSEKEKEEIVRMAAHVNTVAPLNHPITKASHSLLREVRGDNALRSGLKKLHDAMVTHLPSFTSKRNDSPANGPSID